MSPDVRSIRARWPLSDLDRGVRTVMFNNPFSSFHDTVAAAKEEREQLDRLLTISTPRERLLVVGIALLLVILAAWLFLGSVARRHACCGYPLAQKAEAS